VSATRYYLAVYNDNPIETNQFRIAVNFKCTFPPLVNKVPYCTIIPVGGFHIFDYTVATNAVGFMIETLGADGNVDLYVRRFVDPTTTPGGYVTNSIKGGTNNEYISFPANIGAIGSGLWRIGVTNLDAVPVYYCVRVTEIYDTNVISLVPKTPKNGQSVTNVTYYKVNLSATCGTVGFTTTNHSPPANLLIYVAYFRIPSPVDYDLFGVSEGITPPLGPQINSPTAGTWYMAVVDTNAVPISYNVNIAATGSPCFAGPLVIKTGSGSYTAAGFKFEWEASAFEQYQVEFTDTLTPAHWQTITNVISSDGHFEYLDTSAQTNAAAGQRFYRIHGL
jgi:hypothetical protein